jgi:hypothetical protein
MTDEVGEIVGEGTEAVFREKSTQEECNIALHMSLAEWFNNLQRNDDKIS